jgi:integrase
MTGSLQIKNNKYYIALNLYQGGKRKVKWISTDLPVKGNKGKAKKLLREALEQYEKAEKTEQELRSNPATMLFTDAIREWFKQKVDDIERPIDPVTQQGYAAAMRVQILPYFEKSGLRLCDINKDNLQEFMKEKIKNGRVNGKGGLSPTSLRHLKNIINQTLSYFESEGIIPDNPCRFVKLPPRVRYEASFYTMAQIEDLLSKIRHEALYPLIRITALYGLRRSEALGLCWDCVNFESETFTIRRTVAKVSAIVTKDKTKNQSSRRSFPMTKEIKDLLMNLKAQQKKDRKFYGKAYFKGESDYVFRWEDGRPFSPDYVSERFSNLLKNFGMPHIRFHELRHSAASNLLSMGFSLKDVQEWLGHSDIKTTANIYGHLDAKRKISMANALSSGSESAQEPDTAGINSDNRPVVGHAS